MSAQPTQPILSAASPHLRVPVQRLVAPSTTIQGVSPVNILRSEWTKLWTLRSTLWTSLLLVVVTVGISAIITITTMPRSAASV